MTRLHPLLLAAACLALCAAPLRAQPGASAEAPLLLTLDDAVQIALERSYALRAAELDVETADAQIRSAYSGALPSVDLQSSYQRNLVSANPFAGSSAGSFFGSLGAIDWLAFNEQARTDGDPGTDPITLDEFRRRQADGLDAAGIMLDANDNPFAVDNNFTNGITISQTLYDQRVLLAIKGARQLRESSAAAYTRQRQLVVDQTRRAYYQALLAQDQAEVVDQSVGRTAVTLADTRKRVEQGVVSKYQRLSAEVELSNLETQLIQSENQADLALTNLKLTLGLPVERPIRLEASLASIYDDRPTVVPVGLDGGLEQAVATALAQRPDLQRAELAIELQELQRAAARAGYYPTLSAFANLNYTGRVPDNRTVAIQDPDDPFSYTQRSDGFFSDQYWNPDVSVGVRLTWNLFDGFDRRARLQQEQIDVRRRRLEAEQLYQTVRGEVEQALLNLRAAERRIAAQEQNLERARLNYTFASTRLREGVSSALEERQASELLDQSEIGYLQAVHDYLAALSTYQTAVGTPVRLQADVLLTSR